MSENNLEVLPYLKGGCASEGDLSCFKERVEKAIKEAREEIRVMERCSRKSALELITLLEKCMEFKNV